MKKVLYQIFLLLIIFNFVNNKLVFADDNIKSTIGREFLLAFPNNHGLNNIAEKDTIKALNIYIFSVSNSDANIELTYYEDGNIVTKNLIAENRKVLIINLPFSSEVKEINQNLKQSVFLKSNKDIVVYGLNLEYATTDAYIAFPIATLDTSYIVASYNNTKEIENRKRSSLLVAATEDNTQIIIIPSCDLENNVKYKDTLFIRLNLGEVYQIKADDSADFELTGTKVFSTKKIVVIGAHECIGIGPKPHPADHLLEQMPPINTLGANYLLAPIYNNTYLENLTLFRIIQVFDSTKLKINGLDYELSGKFDTLSKVPLEISANKPIMCVLYEISGGGKFYGDPFMAIIPPKEQYMKDYAVISVPHKEFKEHYLNIVVPKDAVDSLFIDNQAVTPGLFKSMPGGEYFWANIYVEEGQHFLKCSKPFGIVIYGIGIANSYGYTGGMRMENIINKIMDTTPPAIKYNNDCRIDLHYFENANIYESKIHSFTLDSLYNLRLNFANYNQDSSEIHLNFTLESIDKSGIVIISIKDKLGNTRSDTLHLCGWELQSEWLQNSQYFYGRDYDDTLRLRNNSDCDMNLDLSMNINRDVSIPPSLKIVRIAPKSSIDIPIVVNTRHLLFISDTISIIESKCGYKNNVNKVINIEQFSHDILSKCDQIINLKIKEPKKQTYFGKTLKYTDSYGKINIYNTIGELIYTDEMQGKGEIMINAPIGIYSFQILGKSGYIINGIWNKH